MSIGDFLTLTIYFLDIHGLRRSMAFFRDTKRIIHFDGLGNHFELERLDFEGNGLFSASGHQIQQAVTKAVLEFE